MTTRSDPSAHETRIVLSLEPAQGGAPSRLVDADGEAGEQPRLRRPASRSEHRPRRDDARGGAEVRPRERDPTAARGPHHPRRRHGALRGRRRLGRAIPSAIAEGERSLTPFDLYGA